jgi:phosphate-selective porin OprO/OprP
MAAERVARAAAVACIVLAMNAAQALAQEKRVVDELLDILKANKQITEEQYRTLKRRAEDERQQDIQRQAVEATALPTPTAAVAAGPPPTPPPGDTMRAYFKEGYNLETADGNFKLNIGGRAQVDWNVSDPSTAVANQFNISPQVPTGVEFRRARISLAGLVYKIIDYKFEYDFADGTPQAKDVYIGMKDIPGIQYVRVGHFKEPFSLEELTSDDFVTFQERGLPNAFAPSRNMGAMVNPVFLDKRLTYAAGGFRETNNSGFGFGPAEYNVTSRLTGLPWYEDGGRRLLHLGFSYTHKFRDGENLTFSQKPESHLFPVNLVNTGPIATDGVDIIDPEIALVAGPWSAQFEYMRAFVAQQNNPNPQFEGLYVYGSWFVTGENRRYRPEYGAFEKPLPKANFGWGEGSGWGAWELAARYSRLNLDSKNVDGGAENDISGEVNWYLNPNTKIGMNYVWANLETVGDSNIIQGRFQLTY